MDEDKVPAGQKKNLLDILNDDLHLKMDELSLPYNDSFLQVALEYLEVNAANGTISDGKGDHGIDYWEVDEDSAVIYQFKSHDFTEMLDPECAKDMFQW